MSSIKDIAADLGVSTTTVSLVLAGKHYNGRISKKMVERVLESAKRLNYHPNMIAKSLKLGSSKSIGLIVADITNPYFAQLVVVVQEYLQRMGYTLLIMNTNESIEQMGRTITMLQDRRVDGFIIVPSKGGEHFVESLIQQKTPLVLLDRYYLGLECCNVMSDNYSAVYECVMRLAERGRKHISFVTIDNDMIQISERLRGYREAMEQLGLFDERRIFSVNYNSPNAQMEEAIEQILTMDGGCDTIIFAINRLSSIGARMLIDRGITLGEQIEAVYFDKTDTFDLLPHPTPHIIQSIAELGNLAAKLLLEQIDNPSDFEPATHLLPCQLNNM